MSPSSPSSPSSHAWNDIRCKSRGRVGLWIRQCATCKVVALPYVYAWPDGRWIANDREPACEA